MATVDYGDRRSLRTRLTDTAFAEKHKKLLQEDLNAGIQISVILTGIILFGLLSMVLSVFAIMLGP